MRIPQRRTLLKSLLLIVAIILFITNSYAQNLKSANLRFFQSAQSDQTALKWESALSKFQQVINNSPKSALAAKAHIEIGKYYKYNREWEKAIDEYHKVIAASPESREADDAKTAEAAIYYFRQDFPRALEIFQEVLAKTKDWDQIKYCSYWLKELNRKMSFAPSESFSCGPQSLKIVFDILKIKYDKEAFAKIFTYQKDNQVSISELAKVASQRGLKPKIVKVTASDVENLNTPFVALLNLGHYVVVTETKDNQVRFIDPANKNGCLTQGMNEFNNDFRGYALIFLEDSKLAKANYRVLGTNEAKELTGGVCWCCPPSRLGGAENNPNVEFDGSPPCSPGMPSWMVNTANLNFIIQDMDFRYESKGMPVEFIRTYNTDDPREGVFGRSWTFNYNITLVENPDRSIDVRRGDGRVDHFSWNGTRYQGPYGVYDTLAKNADGSYSLKLKKDKTTQNFNAQGRLNNIKDRNLNTITFRYDAEGKLTQITDPNNKNIVFTYGMNNKASSIALPDSRSTSFIYDDNNNLIKSTDMKGAISSFTYDSASYVTSLTTPYQGTLTVEYSIIGEGHVMKSITNTLGNKRSYGTYESHYQVRILDSHHRAVLYKNNYDGYTESITTASENKITFEYDYLDNRTKIKDTLNNSTTLIYDGRGNIASITDALNNRVTLSYDSNDNLIQATDPKSNIYNFTYDANGNLTSTKDPDNQTTNFEYNSFGELTRITDAKSGVTDFTYDADGNLTRLTDPLGKLTDYTYDTLGRLTGLTDPKGEVFSYAYDGVDHLIQVTYPDAATINYTYNCCNLVSVQDKTGTLNFAYDALGRLTSFTNYDNKVISYAYDSEGNLITLTYPDNKEVNYAYDVDNHLSRVTDWLGNVTQYNYDFKGNLSFSTSPGLISIYKYDNAGRLTKLINYNANTLAITSGFEFTLDSIANRTKIKDYAPLDNPSFSSSLATYSYNSDNQLISASGSSFEYDDNGNLIQRSSDLSTEAFTYNYNNQLTQYTYGLINISYLYDALGNRISKASGSNTTKYIIDPNRSLPSVLAETNASGDIAAYYVYGLGLISKIEGSNTYFYQYDGIGSTVALTNASGAVINKYAYDEFGNLASNSSETIANPFKYVGKFGVMTDASNLLYMRARYYIPSIGRFINKDPMGGLNLYAYTGNNPISWIDPMGLREWGPQWAQRSILPYGNYCGPANTDSTFRTMPMDSLDELCMEHDKGWANNQCSSADRETLIAIAKLPFNPYKWKRKPRNILWAMYSIPYRGYFMLYLYFVTY